KVIRLVRVLTQFPHPKSPHIRMRILTPVIPPHPHARLCRAPHQRDRFRHHVQLLGRVSKYPDLRLEAELNDGRHNVVRLRIHQTIRVGLASTFRGRTGPSRMTLSGSKSVSFSQSSVTSVDGNRSFSL